VIFSNNKAGSFPYSSPPRTSWASAIVPPINSYDVFDTLIARRSVEPVRVLRRLEARAGVPGLASARQNADRVLGSRGQPYLLRDIWDEAVRYLHLGAAAVDRLLDLEVQLEHDEVVPIAENLALVRDGDLLISDTYLPADIVLSLLRRAGLDRRVALVVSNDGKFRGWLWSQLLAKVAITQHFGDNPHSDGRTPTEAGIPAVIYTGASRTQVEHALAAHGWEPLADLAREVRLANPFPMSRPQERYLWGLSCQLNFPLLFLASLCLERDARAAGASELLFVSRDCLLWHELHRRLFPERRATYLYASRKCLLRPSDTYLEYFVSAWRPDSVIVDLFSTGASWTRLFARLGRKPRCFFIGRIDDYAYLPEAPRPDDWLIMTTVFRNSELGMPIGKGVEMLNYAPHASVEDVVCLPNGAHLPVLAQALEYDAALPQAARQSFQACVRALEHYSQLTACGPSWPAELVKAFVRLIGADPHLGSIYAGHHAADAAYLRQLLG
jgi:hypothetical protein